MLARKAPAVLITTAERVNLYRDTGLFGTPSSLNPNLSDWQDKHKKVVLDLKTAVSSFPEQPEAYALTLEVGREYARDDLLTQLVSFGYERDGMPGVVVRGDTLSVYLDEEDEEKVLRLEFFSDELDTMQHSGQATKRYTLSPLENAEIDASEWTSTPLEQLPGTVYLDSSELFAGELDDAERLGKLWAYLEAREVISFGRDPLELPDEKSDLASLGYYRGKLSDFANDAEGWLKDGYSVTLILKFERTGRYLREKVIGHLDSQWKQRVGEHPGVLGLSVGSSMDAATRGGYRDSRIKEVIVTEDLPVRLSGDAQAHQATGARRSRRRATRRRRLPHPPRSRHRALYGLGAASGHRRDARLSHSALRR